MRRIEALLISVVLLATLFAVPASAGNQSTIRVIVSVDKAKFNPHEVLGIGGHIVYQFKLIPAVVVDVPANAVGKLKKLPGVTKVEFDHQAVLLGKPSWAGGGGSTQPAQTIPWGIERVKAPSVWSTTDGSSNGVIQVAVLDTGVDYDHPDLAGNLAWCVSTLRGKVSTKLRDCKDQNGHGTHVIGTIAALNNDIGVVGVAPGVQIYSIRVLDAHGSGSYSDIAIGIEQAILGPDGVADKDGDGIIAGDPDDDAAEVISMSLGGSADDSYLHQMIQEAYKAGIVIVAASGNEGASSPSYPAAYPEVIAVGAIDSNDQIASWSNRQPEVSAPGVDILSTYPDDTYKTLSGTSMATPHVSGVVALIQAAYYQKYGTILPVGTFDDMSKNTVRGILHITADDLGSPGWDADYGYGVVRADLAVQAAIGG
ncbi:S8 family peptidase [Thermococcus stetteri]|uniref:S8 family peptidase n=1 Tax=Thermococcus stetteri TaxID=49900 RepID=UPI001AE4C94A|nr:S8 family peptidase [Thermococcus stetteri]MBP1911739.1 subtilisin family serine protease [Thermococcus stetteri]